MPVQEQLIELIVFQIVSGRLVAGQRLPSVRALARQHRIHHNTVSKAYSELVHRGWARLRRGAGIYVSAVVDADKNGLDALIDRTIRQAQSMGFSIKELEERVLERLALAPPRCVLVVESEPGLRRIIQAEIGSRFNLPVEGCAPEELATDPAQAKDVFLVAVKNTMSKLKLNELKPRASAHLFFGSADEHIEAILSLRAPSTIAVASYSARLLQTARSLLASALGAEHSLRSFLFPLRGRKDFRAFDVVFCDSLAIKEIDTKKKRHYRLVPDEFLSKVAEWFIEPRVINERVRRNWKMARRSNSDKTGHD